MARRRRRRGKESISGYFRKILEAKPNLLNAQNSNQELMAHWDADHPNQSEAFRKKVMQNLANLKSHLRRKKRERSRVGGRKAMAVSVGNAVSSNLETLEEHIDDCLSLAKHLDANGLESVIKKLRSARNEVVWKQG